MGGAEQRSVLYNIPIMLRNILIVTGLLVAIDPFLGFPQSVDKFILAGLGLFIVFLILLTRRSRMHHDPDTVSRDTPKTLHIERTEVEDSPRMHIERSIIEDTESLANNIDTDLLIENKTTVIRRRKKNTSANSDDSFDKISA